MTRLRICGYLANENIFPDYEIEPTSVIDKFIGDDTGAPLTSVLITLTTEDGYRVEFWAGTGREAQWSSRVTKL
jgi:hypothetical protein